MYELVYGFTPFRGNKRDQTFENILKRPLVFPPKPQVSQACQASAPASTPSLAQRACCDLRPLRTACMPCSLQRYLPARKAASARGWLNSQPRHTKEIVPEAPPWD